MSARYIVRFDDLCPTMNWDMWDRVENILIAEGIKPILAVIPNNRDPQMQISAARADFWERVRGWQARDWTIGLHGDDHRYITSESGIVGLNQRSEFAGLPYEHQKAKIARGLATFAAEGVRADLFVAPSHSFDSVTLRALADSGLSVVSDGFYFQTVRRDGMTFIPQQLWNFRPLPFGVWTVCYHHNDFTVADVARLQRDLRDYRGRITSAGAALNQTRPFGLLDRASPFAWTALRAAARLRASLRGASATPTASAAAPGIADAAKR